MDLNTTLVLLLGTAAVSCGATPLFIRFVRSRGWGQEIRPEGPADHQVKAGTPTMGGAVFVLVAFIGSWLAAPPTGALAVLWFVVLGGFGIGLLDDLTGLLKRQNLGLKARQKLVLQGLLGVVPSLYLLFGRGQSRIDLPFGFSLEGAFWVLAVGTLVVMATTNAVNLADGMDGLATGAALPTIGFFVWLAYLQGEVAVYATGVAFVGALLGFLWHNCYPAKIFMGDTGSMALGGVVAASALLLGRPVLLVLVGGIFVLEAVSVIVQVSYFKATKGKRIFRMSPLHHHFALGGMHETQVVQRFWLVSTLCALLGAAAIAGGCPW